MAAVHITLARLEDMIALTGFDLPSANIQKQIASALDLIVQVERMRDGTRKVTHITEVHGMRDEIITLQDIFLFDRIGEDDEGRVLGSMKSTGLRPRLIEKARHIGRDQELIRILDLAGLGPHVEGTD